VSPSVAEASDFVPVGYFAELDAAFDGALVILAMGLACQVEPDPAGGYSLLADPADSSRVLAELECYQEEQAQPPPVVVPLVDYPSGSVLTASWILILCWSFWMQDQMPGWVSSGLSSPEELYRGGEWWRPFTALFLHADLMHLFSNIGSGVLFGTWVCRSIGPLLGWTLILLAGALGNAVNAASHLDERFASLGASTAVFGALGILTGFTAFQTLKQHTGWGNFRYLLPLGTGLVLLSMMGVGSDPRTDVTGHVCGFLAGLLLGLAAGPRGKPQLQE
jgi:membrane associated rhomboid family serine protease